MSFVQSSLLVDKLKGAFGQFVPSICDLRIDFPSAPLEELSLVGLHLVLLSRHKHGLSK